jgi:hypothetical protein
MDESRYEEHILAYHMPTYLCLPMSLYKYTVL